MDPFLGQVTLVGFNFNPVGWQMAYGQLLPISQFSALFSLLGTMYGGNGQSNFALPNLQGSVAIGFGQSPGLNDYVQGETGGSNSVILNSTEMPNHNHTPMGKSFIANENSPVGNTFADSTAGNMYTSTTTGLVAMNQGIVQPWGAASPLPHENRMPYLAMNWIIAMTGVYPARQ